MTTTIEAADFEVADAPTETTIPRVADGPLADVCPDPIVVQTDGFPAVEHGPLYALLGPGPNIDAARGVVSAPLVRSDGTVEDVTLEIRSGGPAIGFASPLAMQAADDSILLAEAAVTELLTATDAVRRSGVLTLTDLSHQTVLWDPAASPEGDGLDGLRAAGTAVLHVTGDLLADFLGATGRLDADQLVAGFDGEPAAFVTSDGDVAQRADALVEPILYPTLAQWQRPVATATVDDMGWFDHDDALVATADSQDEERTCIGRVVPIIQRSIVAHFADPAATNALMSEVRTSFNPLNRLSAPLFDDAAEILDAQSWTGPHDVVGTFDLARLEAFLPDVASAFDADPAAIGGLVTNEFVEPSVTR